MAQYAADYQLKFDAMTIAPSRLDQVDAAARRIIANWDEYKAVEEKTGVPAVFVGVLHMRECDNDLKGCLHNGQLIIGTKRKTTLEPKGRGPFKTFFDSAVDALAIKGFVDNTDWTVGDMIAKAEPFNGMGYRNHGYQNPYLWGGTQFYKRGKYVRDHVYSSTFVDPQLGVAPVIKRVLELTGGLKQKSFVGRLIAKRSVDKAVVGQSRQLTFGERMTGFADYCGLGGVSLVAVFQQARDFVTDWRTLAILGAVGVGYGALKYQKYRLLQAHAEGRYVPSGALVIPAADGEKT